MTLESLFTLPLDALNCLRDHSRFGKFSFLSLMF